MDVVITVCDNAAAEVCPAWRGAPVSLHCRFPDPAAFEGTADATVAHDEKVHAMIEERIARPVRNAGQYPDLPALRRRLARDWRDV